MTLKKRFSVAIVSVAMLGLSTPSFTGTSAWTGWFVPTMIRQARDTSFQIYVPPGRMINQGCTYQDSYIVNPTHYVGEDGAKRMFAMVMLAVAGNKEINLYVDGTCDTVFGSPAVLHIDIKP